MSLFRSRCAVAALSLAAALFLALPAPSQAAGLWETPAISRVWSWMESLGIVKLAAPARRPTALWAKEGSAIDPNGRPVPGTPTAPPASATSDQRGVLDPDGSN